MEFDALITMDQNLRFQQNLRGRHIRIVVIRARSNKLTDLSPIAPKVLAALAEMVPGELRMVGVQPVSYTHLTLPTKRIV